MSTSDQRPGTLSELAAFIARSPGFSDVVEDLLRGKSAAIDGAWGSSCALTIAALAEKTPECTLLVVVPTIRDADELADELT
ncbi:MAG: hypothetical protein KDA96_06400, partial [Planctomycetaceae bacterium]|nr:hypothetical protein [Planctomycetaceae bacterium]